MTEERLPKEATVEMTVLVGSALGGEAEPVKGVYASIGAAREAAEEVAGRAARAAGHLYASSLRLQALTGQVCAILWTLLSLHHKTICIWAIHQ